MAIQVLDVKLADPRTVERVARHPPSVTNAGLEDECTMPARGIIAGLLLSIPLWAIIGFLLYLLV